MESVVLKESMKLMELMAWKHGRNVNWFYGNHGSDEADRINRTDGILEFSGIVTTALTVLLEQLNYWNWMVTTELLETMELMVLIELRQLMELTELIEFLESWLLLLIGGYDWIERANGAPGISGMKGGN